MNRTAIKIDTNDYVLWACILFAIFLMLVTRGMESEIIVESEVSEPEISYAQSAPSNQ